MGKTALKSIPSVIEYIDNAKASVWPLRGLTPSKPVIKSMFKRHDSSCKLNVSRIRLCERGFTLVELLVVVTVFVALTAMIVPSYIATRPQRMLSGETNRLAGVIRQGRLVALRDNEKVYMEFLQEIDMYRLWSAQGWRAYVDVFDPGNGRNPDIGDYDGDFDGDGDYWWGTGGDPDSPTGDPEDPDVDTTNRWIYNDTDGTFADPDVLLMPTYPGNKPIRTLSPKLRVYVNPADGSITNINRDFTDTRGVAGDSIVPFEVDLRMQDFSWNPTQPLGKRNGILSHFPLIFLVFFPDGTVAASWDFSIDSTGFDDEVIDLEPGRLGATQIHMQVRGEEYNIESYNLWDPTIPIAGDEGPQEPLSQFNTLSLEDSQNDSLGRVITLNNLTGRILIRSFKPQKLDDIWIDSGDHYF